jgi:cytochrome P450
MVLSQYGPNWRELRKLTHTALNTDAVKQYYRAQEDHVYTFLNGLLDRPQDFSEDARR